MVRRAGIGERAASAIAAAGVPGAHEEAAIADGASGEAIALGGQLPALVTRVQEVEARRQELAERLRMIGEGPMVPRVDWRATERQARQLLVDWRGVLSRHPQEARPLLRELLAGEPLRFTPIDESTRRGYRFEGSAVIGGLLEGVVVTNGNWRPHRDSHPMGIVFYRVFRAA